MKKLWGRQNAKGQLDPKTLVNLEEGSCQTVNWMKNYYGK